MFLRIVPDLFESLYCLGFPIIETLERNLSSPHSGILVPVKITFASCVSLQTDALLSYSVEAVPHGTLLISPFSCSGRFPPLSFHIMGSHIVALRTLLSPLYPAPLSNATRFHPQIFFFLFLRTDSLSSFQSFFFPTTDQ